MANKITLSSDGNNITISAQGTQGPTGAPTTSTLQNITDNGNSTTNNIIQIGGKMIAPEFEVSGASIDLSQRITKSAYGNFEQARDNVAENEYLNILVPYDDTGTLTPRMPTLSTLITVPVQPVDSDLTTDTQIVLSPFTGTGDFITTKYVFRFLTAGVEVRFRAFTNEGIELFGTSEDPYVYFTSSAGDTELILNSPISTNTGVTYFNIWESVDGVTPLNMFGQDNATAKTTPIGTQAATTFSPYAVLDTRTSSIEPYDKQDVSEKNQANGYCPLNSNTQVPAALINEQSVTQHEAALEIVKSQVTDFNDADYATASQGTKADSALQNGDNVSELVNDVPYLTSVAPAPVDSVNSKTGVVILDTSDISELTNLYYTETRVNNNTDVAANTEHRGLTDNPHTVTKSQVGLSNVDNTSDADKPVSTAQQTALDLKEDTANKAVANGYASLDGAGHVPASQLPSYVDDVLEFADLASFPVTGETGKIYVAIDTNLTYRWSGSVYVELTDTTAVWGNVSGVLSNQTDLQSALDGKEDSFSKNTAFNKNFGSGSGDVCEGDDSRLHSNTDTLTEGATNKYYTEARVDANSSVSANTAKNSYPPADSTKLSGIEALAEVNTINAGDNVSQLVNDVPYLSTVSGGDHTTLTNIGVNNHAQIDSHVADSSIHFTEGSIDHTAIQNIGVNNHVAIDAHLSSTVNPHLVTKAQVGLGSADNTSDLAKPVSADQQTALDLKADKDGETITNASVNGVTLSTGAFAGFYLNGVGNYVQVNANHVINSSVVAGTYVDDALNNLNIFGSHEQYLEDDTESNTTSSTYVNKLSMVTPVVDAGDYKIDWNFELGNDTKDKISNARVTVDGVDIAECQSQTKTGGTFVCFSGFKKSTLTASAHTIEIDYNADDEEASIRMARLNFFRVT